MGQWLPGDPRGFQTKRGRDYVPPPKRYAKPAEKTYNPDDYSELFQQSKRLSKGAVRLTRQQQETVLDACVDRIDRMVPKVKPALLTINRWHVHLVSRFTGIAIRQAVGQYKQAATVALGDPPSGPPRWWTQGCHMTSLRDSPAVRGAISYLWRHVDEGDLYHTWIGDWGRERCCIA